MYRTNANNKEREKAQKKEKKKKGIEFEKNDTGIMWKDDSTRQQPKRKL